MTIYILFCSFIIYYVSAAVRMLYVCFCVCGYLMICSCNIYDIYDDIYDGHCLW